MMKAVLPGENGFRSVPGESFLSKNSRNRANPTLFRVDKMPYLGVE